MRLPRTDAGLVAVVAVASAVAVVLLPESLAALRTPFGLLLILVLPGGAVTIAARPAGILGGIERTLLWLSLSVAISILTAVALNAAGISLRGPAWALSLMAVTVAGCITAWRRDRARAVRLPGLELRRAELGLAALTAALIGTTIAIGTAPLKLPADVSGTTALWLVPGAAGALEVGVQSDERAATRYILETRGSTGPVRSTVLTLAPGQRVTTEVPVTRADRRVSAVLYRTEPRKTPYRRVTLRVPATSLLGPR